MKENKNYLNYKFIDGKSKISIEFEFNPEIDTVHAVAKEFVENFRAEGIELQDDTLNNIEELMKIKIATAQGIVDNENVPKKVRRESLLSKDKLPTPIGKT